MARTIKVQVDTSPANPGPFGILTNVHDAIEANDTSGREAIFQMVLAAVKKACGEVIESDYETDRALFGIWATRFRIQNDAHTDTNRRLLHAALTQIYNANQDSIQGFNIVWEGDRQNSMVDDALASIKRFGTTSFNIDSDRFSHLQDDEPDAN